MTWSIGIRQKRRKTGLRIIACPLLLSLLCLGQTQGTITTVVVTVPVVDMYSAPNPDADVVSQAIYGSSARALEERQGWVKIRTPDQYTGWLSIDTIRRLSETHPAHASSDPIVQVDSLSANLYREPDVTAHRPLLTVPFEAKLEVVSEGMNENERWLQVRLVDQRLAWIQAGDVNTAPRSLNIEESIALGRRFLGVTYTWGGRSSFGFDCSGFTQMLVRNRGINMPRDADLQAAWDGVTPIDRKNFAPATCCSSAATSATSPTLECSSEKGSLFTTPPMAILVCRSVAWTISPGPDCWSRVGGSNESP